LPQIDAQEFPNAAHEPPGEPPEGFLQSQNRSPDSSDVPPAVVRSARRKHRRSEPPPSRGQTPPAQNPGGEPDLITSQSRYGTPDNPRIGPLPGFTRLPSPPKFSMDPNTFFAYWAMADEALPNRGTVYVYRTWPMIDRQRVDPTAHKYIDKMDSAPDPAMWRQEILHRYGSGNYKLILNDAGGSTKSVGQTLISDLRDPDYPPVINNLDELVLDDPSNQSFLESLRQKGILPGERELQNAESTQALTGTIDKLTNKVVEMGRQTQTPAQPAPGSTEVAKEAMSMARDVFQQGLNLGKETVQAQADAKVAAARAEVEASNPAASMGMLTQIITLAKSLAPTPAAATGGGNQDFTAILNNITSQNSALQQKIFEVLQSQINMLAAQPKAAVAGAEVAAANPVEKDDFVSQLKKLGELKDTMQDIFGGGRGDEDDAPREKPEPMWMKLGMAALAGLPSLAMSLVGMSYNMAVAKTGQGAPMAPNALPPPVPMLGMDGQPIAPSAGNPDPAVANSNQAPGGDMNVIQRSVYLAMLQQIEKPLLAHLNNPEKTGVDFAEAMMAFHGDIAYQATRGLGKEVLMGLLMSYKPIAEVLVTIPDKANQFVDDFLNAEEIIAAEEAEDSKSDGLETLQAQAAASTERGREASASAAPTAPARRVKGK
jgi:hypothetical protein